MTTNAPQPCPDGPIPEPPPPPPPKRTGGEPTGYQLQRLRMVNAELLAALEEIAKGKGRYSRDPYTHACNCIEDMQALAVTAITRAKKQP